MTMSLSDFDTLMEGRYSCRAFRPDPVPRVVIERIVDAARKTPSWCNAQPWQVVITSGEETDALRTALREEAKKGVRIFPFPRAIPVSIRTAAAHVAGHSMMR